MAGLNSLKGAASMIKCLLFGKGLGGVGVNLHLLNEEYLRNTVFLKNGLLEVLFKVSGSKFQVLLILNDSQDFKRS